MANMHPQRHLRLATVAPEVPLADQEAEEEANVEIILIGDELTSGRRCWRVQKPPRTQPYAACCFTVKLCAEQCPSPPERRDPEFSTGWRRRIASSTRGRPLLATPALGKPGITPRPDGGRDDPAIISR